MEELSEEMNIMVKTTSDLDQLPQCGHFLCYLTGQTWTGGDRSAEFAAEVKQALDSGMHVLLAHEMPGMFGQAERHGVEFASFFAVRFLPRSGALRPPTPVGNRPVPRGHAVRRRRHATRAAEGRHLF